MIAKVCRLIMMHMKFQNIATNSSALLSAKLCKCFIVVVFAANDERSVDCQ